MTTTTTLDRLPTTSFGMDIYEARMAANIAADEAARQLAWDLDHIDELDGGLADVIDIATRRRALHTGDAA